MQSFVGRFLEETDMEISCAVVPIVLILLIDGMQATNVAYNKTASQLTTVNQNGFEWTDDKAVDGCILRNNPEIQRCCSSTQGTANVNFWMVDLGRPYIISEILIYGKYPSQDDQLSGFQVSVVSVMSGPEIQVYDNAGIPYGNGIFNITVDRPVMSVIIRRPTATVLTLCEVQAIDETLNATMSTQSQPQGNSGTKTLGSISLLTSLLILIAIN